MHEAGLTRLDYRGDGVSIRLERASADPHSDGTQTPPAAGRPAQPPAYPSPEGLVIKSPMVGVFYSAPGADKKPYVSAGDAVRVGDVLCIIEAMKIMNEITAESDGVVAEIYAENKQVVEFGQPLFRIGAI